jgi:O-antigen/teichoic acid export membrane protein
VQGAAQFLLLPVYTRAFTPGQYGQLGVAIAIALFANAFLSFGLELAVVRMYFRLAPEREKQRSAIATLGVFTLIGPLVGAALLSLVAVPALHGALTPSRYLVLALFGSALFVSATTLPIALLRAEDRLRDYLVVFAVLILSNIVLTAVFVLGFRWGPAGSLLGTLVANALGLVTAARVLPWPRPQHLNRVYLFGALGIGLPMVPHLVSGWVLQLSDRAILGGLVSNPKVGAYTLAVNLATPVLMVMVAVSQSVHPSYGRAIHDDRARDKLPELAHYQIIMTCLVTASVALLGPVVVFAVLPASYSEAAGLIPWLALGYGLWGLYAIPMNAISLLAGRTTWVWTVTVFTAAVKIGALYLLVPAHGIIAAAITLPACNVVLVAGIALVATRTKGAAVPYDWHHGVRVIALSLLLVVPVLAVADPSSMLGSGIRLLTVVILPIALVVGGGLSKNQRRRLFESAATLVARLSGGRSFRAVER